MKNCNLSSLIRPILGFLSGAISVMAVDAIYQNDGSITAADTPPQVDATQFINNGSMTLSIISAPFETRNTTSFINRGIIRASPGIRFETITHQSVRTPALSFSAPAGSRTEVSSSQLLQGFNFTPAQLLALEQLGIDLASLVLPTEYNPFQNYQAGTLTISANTVDIRGRLQTDIGSSIEISGDDVRLINASVYGQPPPGTRSRPVDNEPDGTIDLVALPIGLRPLYGLPLDVGVTYDGLVSAVTDVIITPTLSGPVITSVATASAATPPFRYRDRGTQIRNVADDRLPTQSIDLGNSAVHSYYILTNAPTPTNQSVRAAFVGASDPGVLVDLIHGGGGSIRLLIGTTLTNVADGGVDLIALTLDSSFPTDPREIFVPTDASPQDVWPLEMSVRRYAARSLPVSRRDVITGNVTNLLSRSNLLRVMRAMTQSQPSRTNSPFRPDLLTHVYLPTNLSAVPLLYTNLAATNPFVAFGFEFDSVPSDTELLNAAGRAYVTNNLGRVAIVSKSLDLSRSRISSQGPVVIRTDNLVSSEGASIAAPYVSLNLGSTTGDLKVQGLVRPTFETLSGTVEFFSSTWTNSATFADPASTNDPPTELTAEVGYQFTVANVNVTRSQLTRIHELILKSTRVTVEDSGSIEGLAAANTEELNINGDLEFLDTLNATSANFPRLKRLNIGPAGSLSVPNLVSLGSAADRLESVNVAGALAASGLRLNSQTIALGSNATVQTVRGTLDLTANTLSISNSTSPTSGLRGGGPSAINVGSLNLERGVIGVTNAGLRLTVANSFSAPAASGGLLSVPNGLEFTARPAVVDLSGLTLRLEVAAYADAPLIWPGTDVGAVLAGFTGPNNMAIKSLVVGGDNFSTISFGGPDARNALYVQQIQFLGSAVPVVTNITVSPEPGGGTTTNTVVTPNLAYVVEFLQIPSTFTVYFGSAVTESGVDISDALDRVVPGRLRLVKPAPTGSATVEVNVVGGGTVRVPVSLVESPTLDTDGDGVVNRWDAAPFEGVRLAVEPAEVNGERLVRLSFMAGAGGRYQVEASGDLGQWTLVETVENNTSAQKLVELMDRTTVGGGARNYRVSYSF